MSRQLAILKRATTLVVYSWASSLTSLIMRDFVSMEFWKKSRDKKDELHVKRKVNYDF